MTDLAAYLFVKEYKEDENAELTAEQLLDFESRAFKIKGACEELLCRLNTESYETEEELNILVYNVGKAYYGETKEQLRSFFKDLYLLLFQKTQGTRVNTYIMLLGIEEFSKKLENNLRNPFNFSF